MFDTNPLAVVADGDSNPQTTREVMPETNLTDWHSEIRNFRNGLFW